MKAVAASRARPLRRYVSVVSTPISARPPAQNGESQALASSPSASMQYPKPFARKFGTPPLQLVGECQVGIPLTNIHIDRQQPEPRRWRIKILGMLLENQPVEAVQAAEQPQRVVSCQALLQRIDPRGESG